MISSLPSQPTANSYNEVVDFLSRPLTANVNLLRRDHYQDHKSESGAHTRRAVSKSPMKKTGTDWQHTRFTVIVGEC